MRVACKACCVGVGSSLALGFFVLMIAGIMEKKRFEPFYQDAECPETALALKLSLFSLPPLGTPPFGLFGKVMNATSSCRNPNQVEITTWKQGFKSRLYLPDMAGWVWGVSEKSLSAGKINGTYHFVATVELTDDIILPADGAVSFRTEATANAPFGPLAGLLGAVSLIGYAPLYTKTEATVQSCVKLFGITFCEDKVTTTWCGVLGGSCLAQTTDIAGAKVWVPALCAMTNSVCRLGGDKGEAEMKALVTATNLNVHTASVPCAPETGLPATMTCAVIAQAPGIESANPPTGRQQQVPGFVDGPRPDSKDIEDGESMINLATSLAIAFGVLGCISSCSLTGFALWRWKRSSAMGATSSGSSQLPSILTSQAQATQKQGDNV